MKKDGKKVFAEVPMFPNYIFIESEFNSQEFYQIIESLEKDMELIRLTKNITCDKF